MSGNSVDSQAETVFTKDMTTTQRKWNHDLSKVQMALAPFVVEIDGERFYNTSTPPALAGLYSKLVSVGYANGWA